MSDRLTAIEIEQQEFQRKLRGYDPQDVRLYLKSVGEEVGRLNLENGDMRDELGRLKAQLDEFHDREKALQDALVASQRLGHEMAEKAREEGEMVIREARAKAERLLQQSQDQLFRIEDEIGRARLEREAFEKRLRGAIEQHLELLDLRQSEREELDNLHVLRRRSDAG